MTLTGRFNVIMTFYMSKDMSEEGTFDPFKLSFRTRTKSRIEN